MAKELILCFDGTWDTPTNVATDTNVVRLYQALEPQSRDGRLQQRWYDDGVGTTWYEHLTGGAFGVGLDHKIQQGYAYLSAMYEPGDEVFLYGFSRGAYTARSLVGLVRKSGLVRKEFLRSQLVTELAQATAQQQAGTVQSAAIQEVLDRLLDDSGGILKNGFALYRKRDDQPDTPEVQTFRHRYAQEIPIKFIGVWDTVGALGIPLTLFQHLNEELHGFHDVQLSRIVEYAYHR